MIVIIYNNSTIIIVIMMTIGWGKFMSNETGIYYEGYWKDGLKVSAML